MTTFKNYIFIFIILGCGIIAGIYDAHAVLENIAEDDGQTPHIWRFSIIRCTVAAFTVPLFLKIISSDIINISEGLSLEKGMVLAGICLIAAINSDKFLNGMFENTFSALQKEVEDTRRLQKHMVKQQEEINQIQKALIANQNKKGATQKIGDKKTYNKEFLQHFGNYNLNKDQWNIVKLLGANANNLRLDSINKEIDSAKVANELLMLEEKKLIERINLNGPNEELILLKAPM